MYYNMNKIINEEIAGIDYLLDALDKAESEKAEGYLEMRVASGKIIYHLKKTDQDGKLRSRKLGDEYSPEVIGVKQARFNRELRKTLLADRRDPPPSYQKVKGRETCSRS